VTEPLSLPKTSPDIRVTRPFVSKGFAYRFLVFTQLWQFVFYTLSMNFNLSVHV